jgi:hypothetical protein
MGAVILSFGCNFTPRTASDGRHFAGQAFDEHDASCAGADFALLAAVDGGIIRQNEMGIALLSAYGQPPLGLFAGDFG